MTKRTPSVQEYCHIVDLIRANNFQDFVMYFSALGDGFNIDIYDLTLLPKEYQLPFIFMACRHSNLIAGYLIQNMRADVVRRYHGLSVLRVALEPQNNEISIYLVETIVAQLLRAKVKISRAEINYLDTRILFEPENWLLSHISQAFDQHNAAIDAEVSQRTSAHATQSATCLPPALTVTAVPSVAYFPAYGRSVQMHERNMQIVQKTTKQLANAMDSALQAMQRQHISRLSVSANEIIALFKILREYIPGELTLPKMYMRHSDCFPEHFLRKQVELIRQYTQFNFHLPSSLVVLQADFVVLGQIIGATTIELLSEVGFRSRLSAS